MTDKHTPGPWKAISVFVDNAPNIWSVMAPPRGKFFIGNPVAQVFTGEPDARLIAAAPDMLAALRELVRIGEADEHYFPENGSPFSLAMNAALTAIAKATGGAP